MPIDPDFLLAVITLPDLVPGEAEVLDELFCGGLRRLHVRKPATSRAELEALIRAIPARWYDRIVLHGSAGRQGNVKRASADAMAGGDGVRDEEVGRDGAVSAFELALEFGIPQIHGPVRFADGNGLSGGGGPTVLWDHERKQIGGVPMALSCSVHSHEELNRLPRGLAYAFVSPLFDSISKPGYMGELGLLQRPAGSSPCRGIGLGGITADNLGAVIKHGWDGAAVLGWIWEKRGEEARRFDELCKVVMEEGLRVKG